MWKKDNNPDYPVVYKTGSQVTITLSCSVSPPIAADSEGLTPVLRMKVDNDIKVGNHDFTPTSGANTLKISGVSVTGILNDSTVVKRKDYEFDWEVSWDGTNFVSIGESGDHEFCWIKDRPLVTPLYDRAVKEACGYVKGAANYADAINTGIAGALVYNPSRLSPPGFADGSGGVLLAYEEGARSQCQTHAFLLKYLLESIGVSGGTVTYFWGGALPTEYSYYIDRIWGEVTFQCDRDSNDGVLARPRFGFHALTKIEGVYYDPSYGKIGLPIFSGFAQPDKNNKPLETFPGPEDKDFNANGTLDTPQKQEGNRDQFSKAEGQNKVKYQ